MTKRSTPKHNSFKNRLKSNRFAISIIAAITVVGSLATLVPNHSFFHNSAAAASAGPIVTVGTSIEAGVGLQTGESWPSQLDRRLGGGRVVDRSLGGGAYTAALSNGDTIPQHVDAAIAELHPDVLILGGPVNDLVRLSDVTPLRQAVYDQVNKAYAAGVRKVIVVGIFPFTDGGAFPSGWWPNLESRRQTYNTWAKAMYGANYVEMSPWLKETTTDRGDERWFRDGLHPHRVGAALIGDAFPIEVLN